MVGLARCEQCGGPVEAGLLAGRCPRCLVELAMEPTTGLATADSPAHIRDPLHAAVIGRYKLLRLIGEGGMGTVYEAEQANPRRTVALKIIKPAMTNAESLRRFEQECEALGRLQHPGIAQIYEAGTADTGFGPQPYFAMELIRGRTPHNYAHDRGLDTRQRLELVAKIADAVHHAHQRGLIHRDLKPSNILVDDTGQPKVLDFGVTRVIDDSGQSTRQTDVGQLIGTLAYMSPEQVSGDPLEIDIRTDVYALGVLLYELLTERRPYDIGRKLPDAIRVIQEEEPTRPGVINRAYKGDIETITLKTLEKNKARRYASAAELAADIRRHLKDEPVIARPPSAGYQIRKFSRRHRGLVAAAAAVLAVLVGGIVASTWQAARASRAEQAAVRGRDRAQQTERQARVERDRAAAAEQRANIQRDRALIAERQATQDRNRALVAEQQSRLQRDIAVVERRRADAEASAAREQELLNIWRSVSRESVHDSSNRLDDDRAALLALQAMRLHARTPQQPRYLVEDALQRAAALERWSHSVPRAARAVAFSPDGVHMASGGVDSLVRVWDLRNPGVPRYILKGHRGTVQAVAFSPDGARLASAGDVVRVWDLRAANAEPVLLADGTALVTSVAFSPDGARLASAGDMVRIWDLRNPGAGPVRLDAGVATPGPSPFSPVVRSLALSPDGVHLAAASDRVRVWKLLDVHAPPTVLWNGPVNAVAFSKDGTRLAAGGFLTPGVQLAKEGDVIRVWDLRTPSQTPLQFGGNPFGEVQGLDLSADGVHLAAGSLDGSVRLWDVRNPDAAPLLLRGQRRAVTSVAFSTDSSKLASADFESLRLWDLRTTVVPRAMLPPLTNETAAALSADGRRVASVQGRTVRVWNLQSPHAGPLTNRDAALGPSLAFSADNRLLASTDAKFRVHVWEVNEPEGSMVFEGHEGPIMSLAFSPDGSLLASGSLDRSVRIWNLKDRKTPPRVMRFDGPQGFRAFAFSPDGSTLAFNSIDRLYVTNLLASVLTPTLLKTERGGIPNGLAFTPDGSRLATADGVSQTVRLFSVRDPDAGPLLLEGSHRGTARSVAFSRDGWLASAGEDGTVRLWDLRRPEALPLVLAVPGGPASAVAFSTDGARLLAMTRTTVLEWPLWSEAADYLCSRVWRNLSLKEWQLYVGTSFPYERTCPALPPGEGAQE